MKKVIILLFLISFIESTALGQRIRRKRPISSGETEGYVSAGIQLNALNYLGDIPASFLFTRPGIGAFISRKVSPRLHARLSVAYGRIEGDDFSSSETTLSYARNLHFRNDILELGFTATWDLLPSYGKHYKRAPFTPYLMAGVALMHHNPQAKAPAEFGGDWVDLQPLGTEGQGRPTYGDPYSKIQIVFPVGAGIRWSVNERLDIGIESGIRFTLFDYLDDVAGEYANPDDLANPLAAALSNRSVETTAARTGEERDFSVAAENLGINQFTGFDGQTYRTLGTFVRGENTRGGAAGKNDFYIVTSFHISYIINVGLKCPKFR